ncbi:hypothetical protein BSG1_01845 [Bacillus sp. SG-1]|nr:hypothetical protein BSG1_01845 [Bacillus sp. SG-1]
MMFLLKNVVAVLHNHHIIRFLSYLRIKLEIQMILYFRKTDRWQKT